MNARDNTAPLRDQITTFLSDNTDGTMKTIAAATTDRDYPSRIVAELNRMRADGLIECERRGKGPDLTYWLAIPAQEAAHVLPLPKGIRSGVPAKVWRALGDTPKTAADIAIELGIARASVDPALTSMHKMGVVFRQALSSGVYGYTTTAQPQPEVGKNTGSDGLADSATPSTKAVAVPSNPAPEAASLSADPVAADDRGRGQDATPLSDGADVWQSPEMQYLAPEDYVMPPASTGPQYDPRSVSFNPQQDKAAASDQETGLLSIIADIRTAVGDPTGKVMLGELAAHIGKLLVDKDLELLQLGEALMARISIMEQAVQELGASIYATEEDDFDLLELARAIADKVGAQREQIGNDRALIDKLERLLESARHEADHLRTHTPAASSPIAYLVMSAEGKIVGHCEDEPTTREAARRLLEVDGQADSVLVCQLHPYLRARRTVAWEPATTA